MKPTESQLYIYWNKSMHIWTWEIQTCVVQGSTLFSVLLVLRRRRQWQSTPILLPRESHGWRNLAGCSPWGREESDTTERLHFHFLLSCIGERNGNPLHILARRIPGTEEPVGLPSMGLHRVGHDWWDLAAAAALRSYWLQIYSPKVYNQCNQ